MSVLTLFFLQHVKVDNRGKNCLDNVNTNICEAYKALPCPISANQTITVFMVPAYKALLKCTKPASKNIKRWLVGASSAIQDPFKLTDWDVFREATMNGDTINMEDYSDSVTGYIS